MADPIWVTSDTPEETAVRLLSAALEELVEPRLAVPGGSAAAALGPLSETEFWHRVTLTWVDERCVPVDHPDSNRGLVQRHGWLVDDMEVIPLWKDGDTPEVAVARGEEQWEKVLGGALDAVLLGMGGDGHIASLFVGRPPLPGRIAYVPDSPKPPAQRMTLTLEALSTASTVVVLATGEAKRDALTRLLQRDPALPASALDPIIVTDLTRPPIIN